MKGFLGRVLFVATATCVLSVLAITTGYGVKLHYFDGDSPGAWHETVSLVDPGYGRNSDPDPHQAVLDRKQPEGRSKTPAEAEDPLRLAKISSSPGALSTEQSSRPSARVQDDGTEELFRPSTILIFFLTLLALVGLRRNPTDR
jgi:hypothetical protein